MTDTGPDIVDPDSASIRIRDAAEADRVAVDRLAGLWWPWVGRQAPTVEEWLESHEGIVRVAETAGGSIVGTQRLEYLDRTQCWLSGLGVDPVFRGQGVAGLLLQDAIRLARSDRMLTVRYVTETVNDAVHQLSLDNALRPRGTWLNFTKAMDAAACLIARQKTELSPTNTVRLNPSDRLRVLSLLHASGRTLFVEGLAWRILDDAAVAAVIDNKNAFFARSGVGGWGLAVIGERTPTALEVTLFGADPGCAQSLLEHLRTMACESTEGTTLTIHAPQDTPAAGLLAAAARRGEYRPVTEHPLRVWELSLTG
ncbi:MAG: GNAT family N-acetyltransferase [Thermoleophilia bacterium]